MSTGLPLGSQFVPCTPGQVCHSLGLGQGTGNLKSVKEEGRVQDTVQIAERDKKILLLPGQMCHQWHPAVGVRLKELVLGLAK